MLEDRADYTHVVRIVARPQIVVVSHWVKLFVDGTEEGTYSYNSLQLRLVVAVYPVVDATSNMQHYSKSLLLDLPAQIKPTE
jgi:hypothetical protein